MTHWGAVVREATRRTTAEPGSRRVALGIGCLLCSLVLALAAGPADTSVRQAYIGPGAGLALVGGFMTVLVAMGAALLIIIMLPFRLAAQAIIGMRRFRKARTKRVVVLGLDGLEPTLAEQWMDEGLLPNLARLRNHGEYRRLGTTWPPLSPVAWSSFATGTNPGKHNIFDFIARTPDYHPTISSVRIRTTAGKPDISALRKSKPFWSVLGEHGIFSSVLRVPITFPPDRFRGVQLSAMCVPDLRGTQGMFSYYVEEGPTGATSEGDVGGDRLRVERRGGEVHCYFRGPVNPGDKSAGELRAPFKIVAARSGGGAVLHMNGETTALPLNDFSDWVRIGFSLGGGRKLYGVCKLYLKRLEAPFEMYCTPLQIDPEKPLMPISHPSVFSSYLSKRQGAFYTLGLAEDTWSLSEKLMSEDAFLAQAYDIHAERESMFFDSLRKVRRGLTVCVFDGPDRIQHMFWRFIDPKHPALPDERRASHVDVIREMYVKMDGLVGRTMRAIGPDTVLFVMSDHGFKTFRRCVDLNAWLRDNGYLALKDGARTTKNSYLRDIDWSKTRAFAVGLAGIFLNVKGREASGTVEPGEARALVEEICGKLTGLNDPQSGEVGIKEAVPARKVYSGPYTENAPDIVVGYNVGFRVSWDAAIGKAGEAVFSDNVKAWSGDHCVHPALVPGVLFSNVKFGQTDASITDMAPTVLDLFGVDAPAHLEGKSLLDPVEGKLRPSVTPAAA